MLHFPCLEWAVYTTIVWWVKLKASLVNCGCPLAKDMALQRQCVQTSLLHSWDFMLLSWRLERGSCLYYLKKDWQLLGLENFYCWRKRTFYHSGFMLNYHVTCHRLCCLVDDNSLQWTDFPLGWRRTTLHIRHDNPCQQHSSATCFIWCFVGLKLSDTLNDISAFRSNRSSATQSFPTITPSMSPSACPGSFLNEDSTFPLGWWRKSLHPSILRCAYFWLLFVLHGLD